jgi:hypothetical protein
MRRGFRLAGVVGLLLLEGVHVNDLVALLALAHVAAEFLSLLVGHETGACEIARLLCDPQQDDIAARIGAACRGIVRHL